MRAKTSSGLSGWPIGLATLSLICLLLSQQPARAHGSVLPEDDLCIIEIGFFRAHFTVYQPQEQASEEFCEDLPEVSQTIFVMDYLHDSLKTMAVDFRVIEDITGLGRFANWGDIEALDDLESATVFYQPPTVTADAPYSVEYTFEQSGDYIGIVTTRHASDPDKLYTSVFAFEVGRTGWGYAPLFIAVLLAVQLQYLLGTGTLQRWWRRRRHPPTEQAS